MTPRFAKSAFFCAVSAIAAMGSSGCTQTEAHASPALPPSPVVVELFTSEGCSSCPPADRVLAALESENPAGVIPLAFHVDYWDGIGWKDPFSSPAWTDRQQTYSRAQGRSGVYTPEMVIDGREEFVGSDSAHAETAIATARQHIKSAVTISIAQTGAARMLVVHVGPVSSSETIDVVLALTDARATVDVKSGENAGRKLDHTAIVRSLRTLGVASANGAAFSVPVDANSGSKRAVVFVQERKSRAILGAATISL